MYCTVHLCTAMYTFVLHCPHLYCTVHVCTNCIVHLCTELYTCVLNFAPMYCTVHLCTALYTSVLHCTPVYTQAVVYCPLLSCVSATDLARRLLSQISDAAGNGENTLKWTLSICVFFLLCEYSGKQVTLCQLENQF